MNTPQESLMLAFASYEGVRVHARQTMPLDNPEKQETFWTSVRDSLNLDESESILAITFGVEWPVWSENRVPPGEALARLYAAVREDVRAFRAIHRNLRSNQREYEANAVERSGYDEAILNWYRSTIPLIRDYRESYLTCLRLLRLYAWDMNKYYINM